MEEDNLMATRTRCEFVSWNRTYQWARQLAINIGATGFKPDVIVAIARGGYVPARILCDFLNIYKLASIRIVHYGAGGRKKKSARLASPLNVDVRGLRVLVVDDLIDTGLTLRIAQDHIRSCGAAEVKSATLLYKKVAVIEPDYYIRKVIKWRWIIFPWAVMEDLSEFIRRMDRMPATPQEAEVKLYQEYSVKVPKKILEDVYDALESGSAD
jgi:hypothetical protein